MNIDRPCADGNPYRGDTLNKAQLYITTAGYKNSFAYQKLIQLLIRMVVEPEKAFVMGGTYRIPIIAGLQDPTYIQEILHDGSYNEATFDLEYDSHWAGTVEGGFFESAWFNENRRLVTPELERDKKLPGGQYYVMGVDVGRKGDLTEITVIKVKPQAQGYPMQDLVNIVTMENTIFNEQAEVIRKMYDDYKPRAIVIDGNGIGSGLVDMLVKPLYIEKTGEILPGFGVINDEEGNYKKWYDEFTITDVLYVYMGNVPRNSEMYSNLQTQLRHGRVRFLVDENSAKGRLLATPAGKKMTSEQRNTYLIPYNLTTVLGTQLANMIQENSGTGIHVILKQASKSTKKDKVSSLGMALYWIMKEEGSRKRKKFARFSDMMFLN